MFTILITTYNRRSLLERAVNSALGQDQSCEVLVVDDASEDDTQAYMEAKVRQVMAEEGWPHLVYWRSPQNQGHAQSVNQGVALATGDWIKFLDDDDYLHPGCVAQMTAALKLAPRAVLCSVQAAQVDEREQVVSYSRTVGPELAYVLPREQVHYGMLWEQVPLGTPVQVAVQREAFLRSGGWKTSLDTNFDDIESWVQISRFGDVVFINDCLAYRTLWSGAYNQRFSLGERLHTHQAIKGIIHPLVHDRYRKTLPSLATMQRYLCLHWAIVALKQRQWPWVWRLAFPATLLPWVWLVFGKITLGRLLARRWAFWGCSAEVLPLKPLSNRNKHHPSH